MSALGSIGVEDRRGLLLSGLSSTPFVMAALAAITVFSVYYQQHWGTISDTSWLITVCERMLGGEKLYVDIFDTNPPFSIWLYMPPVALAKFLGIAPEILVHAWTYLAALGGLIFAGLIVRRARFAEAPALFAAAPVVYAMLVVFPGNAFSQREHIGMALFLPMLTLMAWRMRTEAESQPDLWIGLLAGLCGSVLLLVKPHYALMILLPVLFTCWRKRSVSPLFAVEHWVIGLICLAYLAAVLINYPAFLNDVYPLLAEAYLTINLYGPIVQLYGVAGVLLGLALWLYWPTGGAPELAVTAALASAAGVVTLVWQAKGWPYHAYPALLCATVALIDLLCQPAGRAPAGILRRSVRIIVLIAGVMVSVIPFRLAPKPSDEIVSAIRAEVARPTVISIGIDIATAHPLSRMIGGDYRSHHPSLWMVRGAQRLIGAAGTDAVEVRRLEALRDGFIAQAAGDIERSKPDIIFDGGSKPRPAELAIRVDPSIRCALEGYRTLYQDDALTVLIRSDLELGTGAPAADK